MTDITPATSLTMSNKQPILIFNGRLDKRVLPHHTDDLIDLAKSLDIEVEVYKYEDMGHVESIWVYTDEFEKIIVQFFNENLAS